MDPDLRAKLDDLLGKQASLRNELSKLGSRCAILDEEIGRLANELSTAGTKTAEGFDQLKKAIDQEREKIESATPPPLPPEIKQVVKEAPKAVKQPDPVLSVTTAADQRFQVKAPKPSVFNTGEWELNFGRVWLVRIGVLLLLTGLIFLSTYAYKNWLFNAGAGVKVAFFMTISFVLTGAGLWLERRYKRFRQYGRVVASGGLAAGYYTIYAAHFVPSLQLVDSSILAGLLLTLWAGVMLGYAVWKKSRVVAVMAIGLAFYGTVVNPSGWLSLFSALLLSSAGIGLMLQFRWVFIGIGTVIAAYVSHAFWLGVYPGTVAESVRLTYLGCYWLLFTAALMVPQARKLPELIQRCMCVLNNTAVWYLTVFTIPQLVPHAEIGWISLGMGLVWMGLAVISRAGKLWHRSLTVIFGYQGLMVASLGVLIEATGYTRFLVFAVEACILMLGAKQFGGLLARGASAGLFVVALITALPMMNGGEPAHWLSYAALAIVCGVYTGIVKRDDEIESLAALFPACITWVVLGAGVFHQWETTLAVNGLWVAAVIVMLAHVLCNKSRWFAGIYELAVISVPVALIAGWWYLSDYEGMQLWHAIIPILGAGVFWYRCPQLLDMWHELTQATEEKKTTGMEWVFSMLLWSMAGFTTGHHMPEVSSWMILGGVFALGGHALAEFTGRRSVGGPALVFHFVAFVHLVQYGNSHAMAGWIPALFLLIHLVMVDRGWVLLGKSNFLGVLAFFFVSSVGAHAFQEFERPDLLLAAVGIGMAAWAFLRREISMMLAGAVFPLLIGVISTVAIHGADDWLRYLPILSALIMHGWLWRETQDDQNWQACRVMLLVAGLMALAFAASSHVLHAFNGSGLAICWALLASLLFCAGLAIRCRPYRLIGLWWLAAAVLHVVSIDVMRLETLGRILSFITLGLVLLALGFLYNKFQETIRKFL